ncbi:MULTISPECIES: peptide-methionine (S)-S-oxide reductase MsrA [unclassified Rhizobium]|uniref:peptide-methionine (S)-S-oxide reductase MsrA n=1 Tax=unclassified Rhizobium TaxID=2613769 RepID=UPI000DD70D92
MTDYKGMTDHKGSTTRRSMRIVAFGAAGLLAAGLAMYFTPSSAEEARVIPAPVLDEPAGGSSETATFAGGCFWGVQGVFQHVNGVKSATSGYAGGSKNTAQYETVSGGDTGHAESVKVVFDPSKVSYGRLLQIYFSVAHDPTQLNRQGPDTGTQYRSAIFPANDEQAKVAKAYIGQLNQARVFDAAIVTKIEPGKSFYPAEGYHQDFLTNNPTYPYIVINDLPKVAALKQLFPRDYSEKPVLVAASGSN